MSAMHDEYEEPNVDGYSIRDLRTALVNEAAKNVEKDKIIEKLEERLTKMTKRANRLYREKQKADKFIDMLAELFELRVEDYKILPE